ncbi:hypothetical protein RYX36_034689 [Vicia faba]
MDENYIYAYFGNTGKMTSAKVIRNQQSRWDTFSAGERSFRQDEGPDRTIFVDPLGDVRVFGFMRFADESEQMRAMTEMQGGLK